MPTVEMLVLLTVKSNVDAVLSVPPTATALSNSGEETRRLRPSVMLTMVTSVPILLETLVGSAPTMPTAPDRHLPVPSLSKNVSDVCMIANVAEVLQPAPLINKSVCNAYLPFTAGEFLLVDLLPSVTLKPMNV